MVALCPGTALADIHKREEAHHKTGAVSLMDSIAYYSKKPMTAK